MSYVGRASTNVSRGGVFVSYARGDGEEFAGRLRERLEAEGVRLWQDRVGMEGGRDWWLRITEALDRVEFMALVMTPNALRSETVRKEWRYARHRGVCVYPVKGSEGLDFDSLPRWMRDAHFYDLGRLERGGASGPEWKKFVNDLSTRCQARRVPFMAEDMPEDVDVDAMRQHEAVALLGSGLPEGCDVDLRRLAARLGECLATFYSDGQLNDCKWFSDGVRLMAVGNSGVYFLRLVR